MDKENRPVKVRDIVLILIALMGITCMIISIRIGLQREHNDIHDHIVTERKLLQREITKLREEMKAHDEKPEWFERKE